jgi:simple sugar transport system permease protein
LILASVGGTMTDDFSSNYGFIGIAVALVARNSPAGCVAAGLLFAALQQGGGLMETRVGVPTTLVEVTQGLVIVLLAGTTFLLGRSVIGHRRRLLTTFQPEPSDGSV